MRRPSVLADLDRHRRRDAWDASRSTGSRSWRSPSRRDSRRSVSAGGKKVPGIDVQPDVVERPHELRPAAVAKRLPEAGLARRVGAVGPVEPDPELGVAEPRGLLLRRYHARARARRARPGRSRPMSPARSRGSPRSRSGGRSRAGSGRSGGPPRARAPPTRRCRPPAPRSAGSGPVARPGSRGSCTDRRAPGTRGSPASPSRQKKRVSRSGNGAPGRRSWSSFASCFAGSSGTASAGSGPIWPVTARALIPKRTGGPGCCCT